MLDSRAVDTLRLRFTNSNQPDLAVGPGLHGIGRAADGTLAPVSDQGAAMAQLNIDRRGVWLTLGEGARTVHVNGRPVRRMAMLRVGDAIYVDGNELLLLGPKADRPLPPAANGVGDAGDPRILLRGVGGQYHGRSFTLERPRIVGRGVEADIRIDDPAFPERHARIEVQGGSVLLRSLPGSDPSVVNGESVRDAVLRTGDQIVFDAHQRFVVEAPGRPNVVHDAMAPELPDDIDFAQASATRNRNTARRLPWLLLAALLLAAALSAILWFGSPG